MADHKTEKAEQILKKMKRQGQRPAKLYQGPPDMDFLIQNTTAGTGDRSQEKIGRVLMELNASTMDAVGPITTLSGIV